MTMLHKLTLLLLKGFLSVRMKNSNPWSNAPATGNKIYFETLLNGLQNQGTTNAKSKFIPVSPEALEDCHYKGSKDLLCMYLNNNENLNSLQVKSSFEVALKYTRTTTLWWFIRDSNWEHAYLGWIQQHRVIRFHLWVNGNQNCRY
jgi:hypothetical protein